MAEVFTRFYGSLIVSYLLIVSVAISRGTILTVDGNGEKGAPCVFPFKYMDQFYFSCIKGYGGNDGLTITSQWCSTTRDYDTDALFGNCVSDKCQWQVEVPSYGWNSHKFYVGTQSRTHSGFTCQNWTLDDPHYSPIKSGYNTADETVDDAGNYCRNPNHDYLENLCLVTDNFKPPFNITDGCNIPVCEECSAQLDGTYTASTGDATLSLLSSSDTWCAETSDVTPWLQIEFASLHHIVGVITMGDAVSTSFVATYYIEYSSDGGSTWTKTSLVTGNADEISENGEALGPFLADRVKILPELYSDLACMKYVFFGCEGAESQCGTNPCENGGTCEDTNKGYFCACPEEYTGTNCETAFDPCGDHFVCYAGGTCVAAADGLSASCDCVSGFTGDHCQNSDTVYDSCYEVHSAGITVSGFYNLNLYDTGVAGNCEMVEIPVTGMRSFQFLPLSFVSSLEDCLLECLEEPACKMATFIDFFFSYCKMTFNYEYTTNTGGDNIHVKICSGPRPAYCDFSDADNPKMRIYHNLPDHFSAIYSEDLYEESRSVYPIYFVSDARIEAIKKHTFSCSQSLEWTCLASELAESDIMFWDGEVKDMDSTEETCACIFEDPAVCDGCQCSAGDNVERQDSKVFTEGSKIPIKMLDVLYSDGLTSSVTFTLGYLECVQPLVDVDECAGSPCENGGTCEDQRYYFTCECQPGYTGSACELDIDECSSAPCLHGGDCFDALNSFVCQCMSGFDGDLCEINIDDCEVDSCNNGASCVDLVEDFSCVCQQGFVGSDCGMDVDECESTPCQNGGTCENLSGSFSCQCDGYEGIMCETEIDECANSPCQNVGICEDLLGTFTCDCASGFTGALCEIELNECESDPCSNGGACEDKVNGYTCACLAGYTSGDCEINIDDCTNHRCLNGAVCVDGINDYTCDCASGYMGNYCEFEIDECLSEPCKNGAKCVDDTSGYACECIPGYDGHDCEIDINECASEPCVNGGTCENKLNSFLCLCWPGFGGKFCANTVIDGQWGGWMTWTDCSTNCGTGLRTRQHECNNPTPQFNGKDCEGTRFQVELCDNDECDDIDGEWGLWTPWGRCSATCGAGTMRRTRVCEKLKGNGRPCIGDDYEDFLCKEWECGKAINGRWSYWSDWTACSVTCGLGFKTRTRECNDPPAVFGGKPCVGSRLDFTACIDYICPDFTLCTQWTPWGPCSTTCGDGNRRRSRTCETELYDELSDLSGVQTNITSRVEYECGHCQQKDCAEIECYTCTSVYDGMIDSLQCKGPTMKCPSDQSVCMYKFSKTGNSSGLTKSCSSKADCTKHLTDKCIALRDQTIDGIITIQKQFPCSKMEPHPDTLSQLWRDTDEECRICCTSSRCNKGLLPAGNTVYSRATTAQHGCTKLSLVAALSAMLLMIFT